MADLGKLWFELGIKGDIGKELKKYESIFGDIDKAIDGMQKTFDANANATMDAFRKISNARRSLSKVFADASDTDKMKITGIRTDLDRLETHLLSIMNDTKSMSTSGFVSGFLKKETFTTVIGSINDYAKSIAQATREASQAEKEQNTLEANLNKLGATVTKTSREIEKLRGLQASNKYGINTTELQRAYSSLMRVQQEYNNAIKKGGVSSSELQVLNSKLAMAMQDATTAEQKFTKAVKEASQAEKEQQDVIQANVKTAKEYAETFGKLTQEAQNHNRILDQLGNQILSYYSVYTLERFLKSLITIGGEFESQHIALKSMLGDAQQADEIFSQIKSLAPISPFTFKELTSYAKQLTAFNVPFNELYDTTKRLSDISAGLGVDMSRIILAYGQVRSASVLRGQELRQFTEAGIPMVQALADKFTELNGRLVTTGEVFDLISKRAVPFEMVKDILWEMTNEGGRFYDMQLVLSETLAGKWSNLQDAWEIMLSNMANSETVMGSIMKGGVTLMTEFVNVLNKIAPMLAVGGIFAGVSSTLKRAFGLLNLQTAAISKQIVATKDLQANQIQLNVLESKRTWVQQEILASKGRITAVDIGILMNEKKISALQAKLLIDKYKIAEADMQRLVTERLITQAEYDQIMAATKLKTVLGNVGDFFKANAWTIALAAIGSAVGYFWNESEKASNMASSAAENAAQRYENLRKVLSDTDRKNPSSNTDLETEINGIKEALREVDPYFNKTLEKVEKISDLREQYALLREELAKLADSYKAVSESKEAFESVIQGKKVWEFWKDSMDENIKDWNDRRGEVMSAINKMGTSGVSQMMDFLEKAASVYPNFREAVYKNGVSGERNSLFDILNKLIGDSASANEVKKNLKILSDFNEDFSLPWYKNFHTIGLFYSSAAYDIREAFESVRSDYKTMEKQLVGVIEDVKTQLLQAGLITESDMNGLTENYSKQMTYALNQIVAQWGGAGQQFKQKMYDIARVNAGFVMQGLIDGGTGKRGNGDGDDGKTDKKDTLLEKWKEEFNELKKFYSEYKKWAKDVGKDAALKKIQESGVFSTMFADGNPIYDIEQWGKALDEFRAKLKGGSSARNKFMVDVDVEKLNFEYDQNHEAIELAGKQMSEYISDEVAKYNLFEKIFQKTGDKGFAMSAFVDGKVWDDISRGMAKKLSEMLPDMNIDFDADTLTMKKALENNEAAYELWKKIVEIIKGNYTKSLEEAAEATNKLLTIDEKILNKEAEIAELKQKHGENDARVIVQEKELSKLQTERFENSSDYLRFYSAILSMTVDEAERVGASIKENLVQQLAEGNINADKYLKSMKNIDQQIKKVQGKIFGNSDFATFMEGGQQGLVDKRWEEMASAAIRVQQLEEKLVETRRNGSDLQIGSAKAELDLAKRDLEAAKDALRLSEEQFQQLSSIAQISSVVMGTLDGMQKIAQSLSDMFDALGKESSADTWSDIADSIGVVTDTLKPIDGILQSLMSGNISGAISNALFAPVNLITAPITGIAKLHDKKLDRAIQRSQFEVKKLQTAYENLESSINSRLGGIYGGNEYTQMLKNLKAQREEIQRQFDLENDKKKSDKEKLEDYKQSLKEMDDQINSYAADMAESLYNINVKSWAKELTDAVVDAWAKGEDAAEAFHDKVKDIIKDLSVNILTQKVMEAALQPVFDEIVAEMSRKSGQLDEASIDRFAKALDEQADSASANITGVLDRLKSKYGWDISDSSSSSSGTISKEAQSLSEETGSLFASYLNATRADVSAIRALLERVYGSENNTIAQAQLNQLKAIVANTERNADAADQIASLLNSVIIGTRKVYVS